MTALTVRAPRLRPGDVVDLDTKRGYHVHELRAEDAQGSLVEHWATHRITGVVTIADVTEQRHQSYGNTGRATRSYIVTLTDGRQFHASHQSTYPVVDVA